MYFRRGVNDLVTIIHRIFLPAMTAKLIDKKDQKIKNGIFVRNEEKLLRNASLSKKDIPIFYEMPH